MRNMETKGLSFAYAGSERLILKDIQMDVSAGEFICLLGQSGCGKSTFLGFWQDWKNRLQEKFS